MTVISMDRVYTALHIANHFGVVQKLEPTWSAGLTWPKWHASEPVFVKAQQAQQGEQGHLDKAGGGHGGKQVREQWGNLFWLCSTIDELIQQGLEDKLVILVYQSDLHIAGQSWIEARVASSEAHARRPNIAKPGNVMVDCLRRPCHSMCTCGRLD